MNDPVIEEIRRGLREGRFGAETARRWLELRAAARVEAQREVRAHSHQTALRQAHEALDRGHVGSYSADDFAKLFPPTSPIGPDDEDDTSMTGPGHFTPTRPPAVSNQQKRASAGMWPASTGMTDEDWAAVDEFEQYRHTFPPGDADEAHGRYRDRLHASAYAPLSDLDIFRRLWGRDPKPGELDD